MRLEERMEQWPLHRARDAERGSTVGRCRLRLERKAALDPAESHEDTLSPLGPTDVEKGLDPEVVGEIAEPGRVDAGP